MRFVLPSVALLLLVLAGCRTTPPPTAGSATLAHDNLQATLWMQTAAEYEASVLGSYNVAIARMAEAVADPGWDALPPSERTGALPEDRLAVIVDADETLIDNSPFQARGIRDGQGWDSQRWAQWVEERRARALPGALDFARRAEQLGVTVFYVTNRAWPGELQATRDNLEALGFPVAADGSNLLLKGDPRGPGREKGERRRWVGQDHRVLLMLGDNLGDFIDGIHAGIEVRRTLMREHANWWGERWIMLPNPAYGSWEEALRLGCPDHDAAACLRRGLRHD